ncbi:hypothetical protein IJM86_01330 [bacterium]|nr:hypothetical protein [bacterium]
MQNLKGKENFLLLSVDAEQKTRYERILKRGSETDSVTFEEFQIQEEKEMNNTDPAKQNVAECMKLADLQIRNDGTFEDLYQKLDEIFG